MFKGYITSCFSAWQILCFSQRQALLDVFPPFSKVIPLPNFHVGLHCVDAIFLFGSVSNVSSIFFEMRHRWLKRILTNFRHVDRRVFEVDGARQALTDLLKLSDLPDIAHAQILPSRDSWEKLRHDPAFVRVTSSFLSSPALAGGIGDPFLLAPSARPLGVPIAPISIAHVPPPPGPVVGGPAVASVAVRRTLTPETGYSCFVFSSFFCLPFSMIARSFCALLHSIMEVYQSGRESV